MAYRKRRSYRSGGSKAKAVASKKARVTFRKDMRSPKVVVAKKHANLVGKRTYVAVRKRSKKRPMRMRRYKKRY